MIVNQKDTESAVTHVVWTQPAEEEETLLSGFPELQLFPK